jgi:flagellar biosynthetic protein FliR
VTIEAADLLIAFAIFARIGSMIMMFPIFGEVSVSPRVRLAIALACTALLLPVLHSHYPAMTGGLSGVIGILFGEIFVGLLIGGMARLVTSALQIAGNIISMQTSLSFAQNFDPTQGIQGALVGTFLALIAMTMVVATNLHHLLLAAMTGSYVHFVPGRLPAMGDALSLIVDTSADAFSLGMQLSAPFIVFGLVFNLAMGVLAKLMPQVQIFFIVTPASIALGFALFMVLTGAIMSWYLGRLQDHILPFTH